MYCSCPILLAIALVEYSYCATKTKCQVVQALRNQGVPDSDLRDWLCLVKHQSEYGYDVVSNNTNGSKDYGIFLMNSNYFCEKAKGTSSSTCWRVNTYCCADTCSSFTNSDISNDPDCAVRIKNCGFGKWYGWRDHCSNVKFSEYDYSSC